MNEIYRSLINEAQFTGEVLGSGISHLGEVNYAKRGKYFESFTSITTGLERLGKLCVLLDYFIHNNGEFPADKRMRKIGHDLNDLYKISREIQQRNNIHFSFLSELNDSIHIEILTILSKFAKGDRYSNINFLTSDGAKTDPIKEWYEKVEIPLFASRVSKKKQFQILCNAEIAQQTLGGVANVFHLSETGDDIMEINEASFKTGMSEATAKYRRLYMAQIIRYWVELLKELQYKAMQLNKQEIPWLNECFTIFYNEDNYLLTRKRFDRIK